jgi:hypothetical protein
MADKKITQLPASTVPLVGTEVLPIVQSGTTKQVSVANLTAGRAVSATQYTSTIATGTPPLVVTSKTEVANLKSATSTLADSATSANAIKSNATTGVLRVTGPTAASTRVMTVPDANFTTARTDAANSFSGDQTLATGNLVIGTSGKGIDFSATPGTGTSELLADYEEGTFTPTFSCDTGTVTVDTASRTATYTKVGRQVTVNMLMAVDSVSSPTGNLYVDGLPFTSVSNSACSLFPTGFAITAVTSVVGFILPTLNFLFLRTFVQGSGAIGLGGDTVSGSSLRISITYFV